MKAPEPVRAEPTPGAATTTTSVSNKPVDETPKAGKAPEDSPNKADGSPKDAFARPAGKITPAPPTSSGVSKPPAPAPDTSKSTSGSKTGPK